MALLGSGLVLFGLFGADYWEGKSETVKVFFKGGAMGLADIVPGVSGGTIALITGIYDRLITAIASIEPSLLLDLVKGDLKGAKRKFLDIDFSFLLPLVVGIGIAFYLASKFIVFAMTEFRVFTFSFFFGLIFASALSIYSRIGSDSFLSVILTSLLGFGLAFFVVGWEELALSHTYPITFVSGSIAICAMILPGISGAFMLLLLGQYDFMLTSLLNFTARWPYLAVFGAGAAVSLLTFSRAVRYLLENYRYPTLGFLAGLMLGALRLTLQEVLGRPGFLQDPLAVAGSLVSGAVAVLLVYITSRKYDLPYDGDF